MDMYEETTIVLGLKQVHVEEGGSPLLPPGNNHCDCLPVRFVKTSHSTLQETLRRIVIKV